MSRADVEVVPGVLNFQDVGNTANAAQPGMAGLVNVNGVIKGISPGGVVSGLDVTVVPNDWYEFANYLCSAVMPALRNTPVFSDLAWLSTAPPAGLDWEATVNASFPGSNNGGNVILSTVSIAAAQGFIGPRSESPIDWFPSMSRSPWFVAGRGRGQFSVGVANLNCKRAFASIIRQGNANSVGFGYNKLVSPNLCIWNDQSNADIGFPAISAVPYEDFRTYELYGWCDGATVRMAYGDWDNGVEPTIIAEMEDTSFMPDQIAHPGAWTKSTDGNRTDMNMDAIFGKTRQP